MSLTRYLKNSSSPIRKFLKDSFPNTRSFLADARKEVRAAPTIESDQPVPWGTIGTALDYRIRYYFGITPFQELAAYDGARNLTGQQPIESSAQFGFNWSGDTNDPISVFDKDTGRIVWTHFPNTRGGYSERGVSEEVRTAAMNFAYMIIAGEVPQCESSDIPIKPALRDFFDNLNSLLSLHSPIGIKLGKQEEDSLNRHCVVLAFMEEVYRTGRPDGQLATGGFNDYKSLLALPESHWIDDMRELSWRFYDCQNHLISLPHSLNPKFEGSSDVGGADADLIVNGTLIDIKTTKKREIKPEWVWQLLGYVLLDYTDSHQIGGISLYMARQGILFEWGLEDAFRELSPGVPPDIETLRSQFKNLLQRHKLNVSRAQESVIRRTVTRSGRRQRRQRF